MWDTRVHRPRPEHKQVNLDTVKSKDYPSIDNDCWRHTEDSEELIDKLVNKYAARSTEQFQYNQNTPSKDQICMKSQKNKSRPQRGYNSCLNCSEQMKSPKYMTKDLSNDVKCCNYPVEDEPVEDSSNYKPKPWSKNVVCCENDCRETGVWWKTQDDIEYDKAKTKECRLKANATKIVKPQFPCGVPVAQIQNYPYRYSSAGPSKSNPTAKERKIKHCLRQVLHHSEAQKCKKIVQSCKKTQKTQQCTNIQSCTRRENTKKCDCPTQFKASKIPCNIMDTIHLPYKASTEFSQYVTDTLYPDWKTKPEYQQKKIIFHKEKYEFDPSEDFRFQFNSKEEEENRKKALKKYKDRPPLQRFTLRKDPQRAADCSFNFK